jgi:hypothetical protein
MHINSRSQRLLGCAHCFSGPGKAAPRVGLKLAPPNFVLCMPLRSLFHYHHHHPHPHGLLTLPPDVAVGDSTEVVRAAAKDLRQQGEAFSEDLPCFVDKGLCGKDESTSAVHLLGRLLHAKRAGARCGCQAWAAHPAMAHVHRGL